MRQSSWEYLAVFYEILLYGAIPGAFGGLAAFLWAVRERKIRTKKIRKAMLEVMAGTIVASFLAPLLPQFAAKQWLVVLPASFAVGVCWAKAIHVLRWSITRRGREVLKNALDFASNKREDK